MKTQKIILFILLGVIVLFFTTCGGGKNVVARIEGNKITLDDFNVRFEYYLKSKYIQAPEYIPTARADMEERMSCLKDMVNENLILLEAKKMKLDKRDDVKGLIKLYTQQIVINAYIEEYLADDIKVEDSEISDFYQKNRSQFRGMDPEMAKRRIRFEIMRQKYDKKISQILDKLRGKYQIEQNENIIRPIMSGELGAPGTGEAPATIKKPEIKPEEKKEETKPAETKESTPKESK
ncbi:MAG: SurA N-terminal domain-containing protein [Spirochaetes bacterium]|nr:SurA N-terminal domain-containing protein [Spirochaetota bacterium]